MPDRSSKKSRSKGETTEQRKPSPTLPLWKKLAFSVLSLALFFGLIEVILMAIGVKPLSYEKDPYVGFSSQIPLFISQENSEEMLVTARNKLAYFNKQEFSREKPDDTTRVFCLGGSTTYGRPYDDTTSFCGWLRELLPAADPEKKWELINGGGISYASYRVAALMEELADYEPDLFIVYCGQNEFLERRTYSGIIEMPETVRGLSAVLSKTRTYSGISRLIDNSDKPSEEETEKLDGEVNTILDQSIGPKDYERDEELEAQVISHYRFNMARMVDIARAAGAKVIFVTPASNLRNCSPFKSQHRDGLSGPDQEKVKELIAKAKQQLAAKEFAEALESLDTATQTDDQYAHAHYYRGRALEGLQKFDEAKIAYERALDDDVCPLRARSPMPGIVAEVAADRDVPVVNFLDLVEQKSAHGIAGADLFLDHVHPTIEGHRLLALEIFDEMVEQNWLTPRDDWGEESISKVAAAIMKKVDPKKQGIAMRNLSKVYSWAGKMEDAYAAAQKALELFPGDAEGYYQAGNLARQLGNKEEAIAKLSHLVGVKLSPQITYYTKAHIQLSDLLSEQDQFDKSEGVARKLVQLVPGSAPGIGQLIKLLRLHSQKLLKANKPGEAAKRLRELSALQPDDFDVRVQLGVSLVRAGDFPAAATALKTIIEAKPDYLPAYDNLSYVLAQLGRLDEAEQTCLEALKISPDHQAAKKNLALIRRKKATGN